MSHVIMKIIEKFIGDNLIVTGGHFLLLPNGQANLNEGTIRSFQEACDAYVVAKSMGIVTSLGILINDMGGVCDAKKQTCTISPELARNAFTLPSEYQAILQKIDLDPKEVVIYWEKSLRNLGKKQLLKQLKLANTDIIFKDGSYWFVNPADNRVISLTRPNVHDKYGIAACPLIMAALVQQMAKDNFTASLNFYYVDIENEENIPNYFAIEKGRVVAENFFPTNKIANIYLLNNDMVTSFDLKKYENLS